MELLYRRRPTEEATKPTFNATDTINAQIQLSSICDKTDLFLHKNNKFDNVKNKKGFNTTF